MTNAFKPTRPHVLMGATALAWRCIGEAMPTRRIGYGAGGPFVEQRLRAFLGAAAQISSWFN
jgi:hypothetical protein